MRRSTVLLVSSDSDLINSVKRALESTVGMRLRTLSTYDDAARFLSRNSASLVLGHLSDRGDSQLIARHLLPTTAQRQSNRVIVIGDAKCAEAGLSLLRDGALEYLERPLDLARLAYLVDSLTLDNRFGPSPKARTVDRVRSEGDFLYSPNEAMAEVMDQINRVASVGTNILIHGESGTGKTRLARVIHELSPRRNHPFRVVNCASLSPSLIESEMFGHVRGAFTGADRDRKGKFAEAIGGTLLLDDVNTLPIELQVKLLRVVEDRVFDPVGGNQSVPLQARLIAASNQDLNDEVRCGRFREDLFYRLNVITFGVPPLREQPLVLPDLVAQFVKLFAESGAT